MTLWLTHAREAGVSSPLLPPFRIPGCLTHTTRLRIPGAAPHHARLPLRSLLLLLSCFSSPVVTLRFRVRGLSAPRGDFFPECQSIRCGDHAGIGAWGDRAPAKPICEPTRGGMIATSRVKTALPDQRHQPSPPSTMLSIAMRRPGRVESSTYPRLRQAMELDDSPS